jgi:hypothetical protein
MCVTTSGYVSGYVSVDVHVHGSATTDGARSTEYVCTYPMTKQLEEVVLIYHLPESDLQRGWRRFDPHTTHTLPRTCNSPSCSARVCNELSLSLSSLFLSLPHTRVVRVRV